MTNEEKMDRLLKDVAGISAKLDGIYQGCPHRERIQQATNNHERLARVEQAVINNRVKIAQFLGASAAGGTLALIGDAVITALLKK